MTPARSSSFSPSMQQLSSPALAMQPRTTDDESIMQILLQRQSLMLQREEKMEAKAPEMQRLSDEHRHAAKAELDAVRAELQEQLQAAAAVKAEMAVQIEAADCRRGTEDARQATARHPLSGVLSKEQLTALQTRVQVRFDATPPSLFCHTAQLDSSFVNLRET